MKSHIYEMLENFFDANIIDMARKMNYDEDNIIILESDENKLKEMYPETYNNLKSCTHNRDSRTMMEYAQDIICSWIFEDYLLLNLLENGFYIELNGADSNRKILRSNSVSASSDYFVEYNGKKGYIELANDYKGYWQKYRKCDLRDDKYLHLKEMAQNTDFSLLLGIDFFNKSFFLIDINDKNLIVDYIAYHRPYGGKPAYSIDLKKVNCYDFKFTILINEIKKLIDFDN